MCARVCAFVSSVPVLNFAECYAAALLLPGHELSDLPHSLGLHPLCLLTETVVKLQLLHTQTHCIDIHLFPGDLISLLTVCLTVRADMWSMQVAALAAY